MTAHVAPAAAPGPLGDPGAAAGRRSLTILRRARDLAGVVPFTVYVLLGLVLPMGAILVGAFKKPVSGSFTLHNLHIASHGIYLHGFATSMELSLIASVVPGILGFLIAYAIFTARRASVLRRVAITASGVFANFGGVPLAFLFIATLGNTGLATQWLADIGFNPYNNGFDLYGLGGVALVYMYFQIPLMVLVILPAFEGLRPAWREAAHNMGAKSWQYWRYVGVPVLAPSVLGADPAAVRQRVLGLRHGGGPDQRHHPADLDPDRVVPERERAGRPAERRLRAGPRHGGHHRGRHARLRLPAAEGGAMAAVTDAGPGQPAGQDGRRRGRAAAEPARCGGGSSCSAREFTS